MPLQNQPLTLALGAGGYLDVDNARWSFGPVGADHQAELLRDGVPCGARGVRLLARSGRLHLQDADGGWRYLAFGRWHAMTDAGVGLEPRTVEIAATAGHCAALGCELPIARIVDGRGFCSRHRSIKEDPPVVYCACDGCGVPAVRRLQGVDLCGRHEPRHAAIALVA
jgi:hypothetical protein